MHVLEFEEKCKSVLHAIEPHTDAWQHDVEVLLTQEGVEWTIGTVSDFVCDIITDVFSDFCRDLKERATVTRIADELRRGVNAVILGSDPAVIAHRFRGMQSASDDVAE